MHSESKTSDNITCNGEESRQLTSWSWCGKVAFLERKEVQIKNLNLEGFFYYEIKFYRKEMS